MASRSFTVLVTGIGGNVGQGILRVLRSLPHELRVVGTNTRLLTAGNHLCDAVHEVPIAWDEAYIPTMEAICERDGVDLIIPATDFEAYHLSLAAESLPALISSPRATEELFLDKLQTAEAFVAAGIPFARSMKPSQYRGEFTRTVVKPRRGWGSRDINFDPADPSTFGDDYVVQELLEGAELTAAFYVTKANKVHSVIVLERRLANGTTVSARTAPEYVDVVSDLVNRMHGTFDISGPCNVQAIVAPGGRPVPFEVNCRFSGTTSIRHNFGFKDVEWALQEHLLGKAPDPPALTGGRAERMLVDVIYPEAAEGNKGTRDSRFVVF